jgi:hypothetical protein
MNNREAQLETITIEDEKLLEKIKNAIHEVHGQHNPSHGLQLAGIFVFCIFPYGFKLPSVSLFLESNTRTRCKPAGTFRVEVPFTIIIFQASLLLPAGVRFLAHHGSLS